MATNKIISIVVPLPTRTGDTVASYNAYSSVDGLLGSLSVAEAAAGKTFSLSDDLHNITVKTVWTTAGESTTNESNVVVVDLTGGGITPLLTGFTGVEDPMVTDAEWENVNTTTLDIRCKLNNNLEMESLRTNATGEGTCQVKSVDAFDISTLKVLKFDVQESNEDSAGGHYYGMFKNDIDTVGTADSFYIQTNNGDLRCNWRDSVGTLDSVTYGAVDFTTAAKSIKIVLDSGTVTYYLWSGSAWLVADTKSYDTTGSLKVDFSPRNFTPTLVGDTTTITDVYVTDVDYATQNPV